MHTKEEVLKEYLNSKYSLNTQNYINFIIEILNSTRTMRAKDLNAALVPGKIPFTGLLFRLLKEMVEREIITKEIGDREPGKKGNAPTYYKLES